MSSLQTANASSEYVRIPEAASNTSVALCTYNGERFLNQQLESIQRQTRIPTELVVCDDQSTDGTIDILEMFQRAAPFPVRILRNSERLGVAKNFERAISECRGDIIALADQDDIWLPEKLFKTAEFFEAHPDKSAVFSDAEMIDEKGRPMGRRLSEAQRFATGNLRRKLERDHFLDILFVRNICTGATMAIRRDLLTLVLPFPQPMPNDILHDAWMALVAALHHQLGYLNEPLIQYRQHSTQELGGTLPPHPSLPRRLGWSLEERQYYLRQTARKSRELMTIFSSRSNNMAQTQQLQEYIDYVDARAHLPKQRIRRWWPVLRHLSNGHYSRYSEGLLTAIRDLM